jgi:hypothetical protein
MQVMAFCAPSDPEWRWRIIGNDGAMVEESHRVFPSIAAAVSDGQDRARALDLRDLSERTRPLRMGSRHMRSR